MSNNIEETTQVEPEAEVDSVDTELDQSAAIIDESIFKILTPVDSVQSLKPGDIIVRWGDAKKQQGVFQSLTDTNDGLIVTDVIDLSEGSYLTEAGIIRQTPDDKIYKVENTFQTSGVSNQAREILKNWVLFTKLPALQKDLQNFVESCYFPEQLTYWKNTHQLSRLFIPLQQKFKIGKHAQKIDYEKELAKRFGEMLSQLYSGKHLTYVAFVPREANKLARFYSIGTKPHLETKANLRDEPGGFNPNQGGHIAVISKDDETPKRFLVDAGSYDIGSGMQTSLAIAEMVTNAMKKAYPQFEFKPVAGRGAHGTQQSY